MNARTRFLAFGFWFLAVGLLFAQNSRFELFLRSTSNTAVTGATVYVVHMTTGDSLLLSEVSGKNGYYRRDNVEFGNYKIYVNGSLSTTQKFHPTDRIYLTLTNIDPDGNYQIDTQALENGSVTLPKLSSTLQAALTGGVPSNAYLPDDASLELKISGSDTTFAVKENYFAAYDTTVFSTLVRDSTAMYINLGGLSSENRRGGGIFDLADSTNLLAWFGTATPDGGVIFAAPTADRVWFRREAANGVVLAEWYGAQPNTDNTFALQKSLDLSENSVVSVVRMAQDTNYVSIANSISSHGCVIIPSNIIFEGYGDSTSVIARLPGERGTDGILLLTKNYSSATGYSGTQNIVLQNFSITDGAITPQRSNGDLIGLAHTQNVIIRNIKSYNHDQHFVDMAGAAYVEIYENISDNAVSATTQNAIYQIDWASQTSAIWGINPDSTACEHITIRDNKILRSYATDIVHFHRNGMFSNIDIRNNYINVQYGQNGISKDTGSKLRDIKITHNTFYVNSPSVGSTGNRAINFLADDTLLNVDISHNVFRGIGPRCAIWIGDITFGSDFLVQEGVIISNNIIDLDYSTYTGGQTVFAIQAYGMRDVSVNNNKIGFIAPPSGTTLTGIVLTSNQYSEAVGNELRMKTGQTANSTTYGISYTNTSAFVAGKATNCVVKNNNLYGGKWKYGINFVPINSNFDLSRGLVSGNFVHDSVVTAHYYIDVPASDGTNNVHMVDFTSEAPLDSFTTYLFIEDSSYVQDIPLKYSKTGTYAYRDGWKYDTWFIPSGLSISQFPENYHGVSYVSPDSCIGYSLQDWKVNTAAEPDQNVFSVVACGIGVATSINKTTFKPTIRTSGLIQVRVGL